jgi:rfaE bifunctional protein kinase chain/domain
VKLDFSHLNIMVVGESCVDAYTYGRARGQPCEEDVTVPVVTDLYSSPRLPGMSANVAMNLKALGASCELFTAVGCDDQARFLKDKVGSLRCVYDKARTALKERLVVDGKLLARLDREDPLTIPLEDSYVILDFLVNELDRFDAVILQDYGKGLWNVVTLELIRMAQSRGKKVFVDPYRLSIPEWYRGAYLIKPNRHEASAMLGGEVSQKTNLREFFAESALIRMLSEAEYCVLTAGELGMYATDLDGTSYQASTEELKAVDVAGAGDTALSVLTLALMSGIELLPAMRLANKAAGIVVQQQGVSSVTVEDLI